MTKAIDIFEPAMCCDTGICGPSIDPNLLRITAVCQELDKHEGITAKRHNLTSAPLDFTTNKAVSDILQAQGVDVLPVTLFDGEIVKTGEYSTSDEITAFTGVPLEGINKPRKRLVVEKPKKKVGY